MAQAVEFLKSAVLAKDYPAASRPEIAVAGRSNAGKSSFINSLTHSKIAKVSQEAGKTRLLNFFDVGQHYRLVDTPGYGFASRSGDEIRTWQEMIETYLSTRGSLVGLLLLMDIRREWEEDEKMLVRFMRAAERPVLVMLTKADRCKAPEILKRVSAIKKASRLDLVFPISCTEGDGIEEVEEYFFRHWVKPFLGVKK